MALAERGDITLGVVGDAARGDLYVAERGRGSHRLGVDDEVTPIRASGDAARVALDPGRPGGAAAELAARTLAQAVRAGRWEVRVFGTSLDLVLLASGSLAAVWHFSRIPPLHFAAGVLVAREAGASVTDNEGADWGFDATGLLATASGSLHAELLRLAR